MDDWQQLLAAGAARQQQTAAGFQELAQLLAMFRGQLLLAGFGPEDAQELVRDYFGALLDNMPSPGEGGD